MGGWSRVFGRMQQAGGRDAAGGVEGCSRVCRGIKLGAGDCLTGETEKYHW